MRTDTRTNRIVYGGSGMRYQTNIAPDGSYTLTTFKNGRPISTKRCDRANTQTSLTTHGYDSHGRRNTATDSRNGTTLYTFNDADFVQTVLTPNPGTLGGAAQLTATYYNKNLQVTNVVQPDGSSTITTYNLTGEKQLVSGGREYPTGYGWDYAGRISSMTNWTDFANSSTKRVTQWNYNAYRGWLDNKRYPDGKGPDYTYTPGGRLLSRVWARLGTGSLRIATTNSYGLDGASGNAHGDLVGISYHNDPLSTPSVSFTYDRRGRQVTVGQGSMSAALAYDSADHALSEAYTGGTLDGLAITNGYNSLMVRTNLVLLSGSTSLAQTAYDYDAASRLVAVTDNGTTTNYSATYSYVANSPLVSQIIFKQNATTRMTTTKTWDNLNRLTSISSISYLGSAIASFSYDYNSANQRTRCTTADGSFWIYKYDNLGQVISGKKYWPDWTPVAGQQFTYGFDDIGNRTATGAGGDENGANLRTANYYANDLNQYTNRTVPNAFDVIGVELATNSVSVNGMAAYRHGEYFRKEVATNNSSSSVWAKVDVTAPTETAVHGNVFVPKTAEQFYYDFDGNLTNDGRFVYTWDAENRLTKVRAYNAVGPQISLKFEYDFKSRRIRKQVYSDTTWTTATNEIEFAYDGWNLLGEVSGLHTCLRRYLWGAGRMGNLESLAEAGSLLAKVDGGEDPSFYHFDGNGNVVGLVRESDGCTVGSFEYGPFGETLRCSGPEAAPQPFRFATKYFDLETGDYYYGYRFYCASAGIWLSKDPAGEDSGDINLYSFVGNDSVSRTDRLGLTSDHLLKAIAAIEDARSRQIRCCWKSEEGAQVELDVNGMAVYKMVFANAKVKVHGRVVTYTIYWWDCYSAAEERWPARYSDWKHYGWSAGDNTYCKFADADNWYAILGIADPYHLAINTAVIFTFCGDDGVMHTLWKESGHDQELLFTWDKRNNQWMTWPVKEPPEYDP